MKYFFTKYSNLIILLLLTISIVVFIKLQFGNTIYNPIDHMFPFSFKDNFLRVFYLVNDYIFLGWNNALNLSMTLFYNLIFLLPEAIGLNFLIINKLEIFLSVISLIYFTYLFLCSLFNFHLNFHQKFFVLLMSLTFLTIGYNTVLFLTGISQQIFAFSSIPLILWGLIRFIKNKNSFFLIPILIGCLILPIFNLPFLVVGISLIIFIIFTFNFLTIKKKIVYIFLILLLFLLVNAFWIVPFLYSTLIAPPQGFASSIAAFSNSDLRPFLLSVSQRYKLSYLFSLLPDLKIIINENGEHNLLFYYYLIVQSLSYMVFIIIIAAFLLRKKLSVYKVKIDLRILLLFLLFYLFLAKAINNPFEGIYLWLFDHTTFFKMFRDGFKWMEGVYFIITIFLTVIIVQEKKILIKILVIFIPLLFLVPWLFGFFGRTISYTVPDYYFTFQKNLKIYDQGTDRALSLNSKNSTSQFIFDKSTIRVTSNIIKYISPISIVDLFSPGGGNSLEFLLKKIPFLKKDDRDLALFQTMGLTHLFLQQDIQKYESYKYSSKYFDIQKFGKIIVYKMKEQYIYPRIYTDNGQVNAVFKKISPVEYVVLLKHLDKNTNLTLLNSMDPNWTIYLNKFSDEHICSTPKIQFQTFSVSECQSGVNALMLSSQYFFTPSIFQESHVLVNGYANGWQINSKLIKANYDSTYFTTNNDGSINVYITLYYRAQIYFFLGLYLTVATLLSVVCFIVIKNLKVVKKIRDLINKL